ncbi:hypothetical protein [Lacrimispora sp. 38-1]|uniref:alpha-L-rhamnosidase-related protein n=1 Tax=Lacrimispora sp. 38-1 TaxID=3125778 RepID=UPI003CE91566
MRIQIEADEEEVTLYEPIFRRTGYPLEVGSYVKSSEEWVSGIWNMCVNTLKNCMTETYMDCPFYEQMQFSMDTRLQALFTYAVSNDTTLAKKALKDFHNSMMPDGLIQGKYPSAFPQIISTFSLHYIYMIFEYYQQTGDLSIVIAQIQNKCWDENKGLFKEGPDFTQYTQHAQAWAVLNEMVPLDKGREILEKTFYDDSILKCSFSTSYELFRAMEKTNLYGETKHLLNRWIHLLDLDCTTCPFCKPDQGCIVHL